MFAGPGAGKTLGRLLGFRAMRDQGRLDHFLVFCHRTSILNQWKSAAARLGLRLEEWPCPPEQSQDADGLLVTYQGAGRQREALGARLEQWGLSACMAIADEAHHLGVDPDEPDATAWGQTFLELTGSVRLRLGLTGTPFRADNLAFCAARRMRVRLDDGGWVEQIRPDLCVEPRELDRRRGCAPPGVPFPGRLGGTQPRRPTRPRRFPLSREQRESWRARNLRRAIRLADSSSIGQQVLLRAQQKLNQLRERQPQAAGLVIARDISHAEAISRVLMDDGNRVELIHSQSPQATERLNAFQSGDADWLVSIDMCAEGFDAPRLRVVAYLTTVVTRSRFVQGITRAVRMTPELAAREAIPREASYVFAPADPLLMDYARSWSVAEPYVLRPQEQEAEDEQPGVGAWRGPSLPLEAVEDGAGAVIRLKTPELPAFLQR